MVKAIITTGLVLVMVFSLTACHENGTQSAITSVDYAHAAPPPLDENVTCRSLSKSNQNFNISGSLTAEAPLGDKVYLYIAPDAVFERARYVVDHCPPVMETALVQHKYFSFEGVPPGQYVAGVPGSAFVRSQGYPMIREFNFTGGRGNLSIKWHGGDYWHSMLVFSLEPLEPGGGK